MKKALFNGVCTALVTPFLNLDVNLPLLHQLIRRQVSSGVQAVVLCGTTGESPTLSDDEKIEIIRSSKDYIQDQCLIIAGTGSNDTLHAVKLSIQAEAAGADAILVVSPYYNKSTPEGLIAHYTAIATSVRIPVILYNVPSRTGLDIPVAVYQELSKIENIVGVKEASNDLMKVSKIRRLCPEHFTVWTGNDAFTVPAISLGAKGVISVVSNLWPKRVKTMTESALRGDLQTAAALQYSMEPLQDLLFSEVNPIPVKAAMKYIGYNCGICRLPLSEPSAETAKKLEVFFHR